VAQSLGVGGPFLADENPEDEAEHPPPTEAEPTSAADAFQQRARLAEDRLAEVLAAYRKLKTENEGYRDRITRNLERRFDQRRERLLLKFIEILDNLDRALEAAELSYAGNPLIEGLILVRTQLLQTLQEEGLERIPVVGLPYDPGVSEAVETRPVEDPEQHHVVLKDLQRGYRLNGRVARASKVVVGEHAHAATSVIEPQASAEEETPAAEALHEAAPVATELLSDASLEDIVARIGMPDAPAPDKDEES
jgi:molecular chaperone GrpE